jgi:hypothetical protein
MTKYTLPMLICAGLLLVSGLARAILEWPSFLEYFPYFMWVHVAIIALAFYGFWVLRRAPRNHVRRSPAFARSTPILLAVLALPVVFAFARGGTSGFSSLGTTPDGLPVHHKAWIQEGDRHYVVLNRTVKVEISADQHNEHMRESYVGFSSYWILFSYLVLVLWYYNWRRERLGSES